MRTFIYPYKQGSRSARALAERLNARRIRLRNSKYVPRPDDRVINWGHCNPPVGSMNGYAGTVGNKLRTFEALDGVVNIPIYASNKETALEWLREGYNVVERALLRGSGGAGITIYTPLDLDMLQQAENAPLYTKYIPKVHEYRCHVFGNEVKLTQRKMRRWSVPDERVNWQVRNLENGFIYGTGDVEQDLARDEVAVRAVQALSLDFGAVDVIYQQSSDSYYVLEVNTAPGLEGRALDVYAENLGV